MKMYPKNNAFIFYFSSLLANLGHSIFLYSIVVYTWDKFQNPEISGQAFISLYLPLLLTTLHAGKLADKHNKIKLIIASQSGGILASLLIYLASDQVSSINNLYILFTLIIVYGLSITYCGPARFAVIPEVVGTESQEKGTLRINVMNFAAMGIGPVLAGTVYHYSTIQYLFLLPVFFFLISNLLTFALIHLSGKNTVKNTKAGSYLKIHKTIGETPYLLALYAIIAGMAITFLGPFQTMAPIFAKETIKLDELFRGALMLPFAIGMATGGAICHTLLKKKNRGALIIIGNTVAAILFIILSCLTDFSSVALAFFILGTFGGATISLCGASIQNITDQSIKGQIMGIYTLLLIGATAIGSGIASTIATYTTIAESFKWMGILSVCFIIISSLIYKPWLFTINVIKPKLYANVN